MPPSFAEGYSAATSIPRSNPLLHGNWTLGVYRVGPLMHLWGLYVALCPPNDEQYSLLTQEPSPLLELVMFLYRLCNHAVKRKRTAYLSNWKSANSAIHQIPITLLRSNSDKIIESLLMIMASAPYMLITAPVVIPVRRECISKSLST